MSKLQSEIKELKQGIDKMRTEFADDYDRTAKELTAKLGSPSMTELQRLSEEEIRDGLGYVEVKASVPDQESLPIAVTLVDVTVKGMMPWQAKKLVRFLKESGL